MQSSDLARFGEILNGLAAIKPGKELTKAALKIWWNAMQEWTIEEFAAAATHLASSVEFMPSPFHFEQLRKAGRPTADEAWQIALERCKHWRTPAEARDTVDRTAAAIGGYSTIALANQKTALPHVQRRFLEAYDKIDSACDVRKALPRIAPEPQLPVPRINSRDGRFTEISSPSPTPKSADPPKALTEQSREQVTEWLKRAGT
jgi:hypothetical protein